MSREGTASRMIDERWRRGVILERMRVSDMSSATNTNALRIVKEITKIVKASRRRGEARPTVLDPVHGRNQVCEGQTTELAGLAN